MPAKLWHGTLKSKYYVWNKKCMRNKHSFHYVLKSGIIVHRIMLYSKSTFSEEIQMVNPMHLDAVASGCDRGGNTTS